MQWFLASDFRITKLKKISNISCICDFQINVLLVKIDQHWKTFQIICNMTMFRKQFTICELWHYNILYLSWYLIWKHSVLLKIGQYTKSNLMMYDLSMFGKIIFVVSVNYDVISIEVTGSLEKCGGMVLAIVSPTDEFKTIIVSKSFFW